MTVTAGTYLLTTHGITLIEHTDQTVHGWAGPDWAGYAFPRSAVIVGASGWVGRRRREEAADFTGRHAALAHLVGGCPDCVCDQESCRTDDTGEHCASWNCGYCLHGCSDDEPCPMVVGS